MYCRPNSKPYNNRPNIFRPLWLRLKDPSKRWEEGLSLPKITYLHRSSYIYKNPLRSSQILKNLMVIWPDWTEKVKSMNIWLRPPCYVEFMMRVQQRFSKIFTHTRRSLKILKDPHRSSNIDPVRLSPKRTENVKSTNICLKHSYHHEMMMKDFHRSLQIKIDPLRSK